MVDIPTKFHEVWWKESKNVLISLFCFYGNCGKFVQPIPIFLAYLVPIDVDVVPNKSDQFLLGE